MCVEDEVDTELRVSSCAVTALEKRRREGGLLATFSDISRLRLLLPLELLQQPSPSVSDKWQRCENALNKNKKSVTLWSTGTLHLSTNVFVNASHVQHNDLMKLAAKNTKIPSKN